MTECRSVVGTLLIVVDKPICVVFVVGDGVKEKERDQRKGGLQCKDLSFKTTQRIIPSILIYSLE